MNGETIAMIKALQNKSIENLKTSGGSADAGKVLTVGNDGRIAPIDLPVGEGEIALDGTLTIHGAAAGAKETGDAIRSLNGRLDDAESYLDPLGLIGKTYTYTAASGYQNVPMTINAGTYSATCNNSGAKISFRDANNNTVSGISIPQTANDYQLTVTSEQSAAIAFIRMYGGAVTIIPNDSKNIIKRVNAIEEQAFTLYTDNNVINQNIKDCKVDILSDEVESVAIEFPENATTYLYVKTFDANQTQIERKTCVFSTYYDTVSKLLLVKTSAYRIRMIIDLSFVSGNHPVYVGTFENAAYGKSELFDEQNFPYDKHITDFAPVSTGDPLSQYMLLRDAIKEIYVNSKPIAAINVQAQGYIRLLDSDGVSLASIPIEQNYVGTLWEDDYCGILIDTTNIYGTNLTSNISKISADDNLEMSSSHVFYCGANRILKTLKSGIEAAEKYMNSILYVDEGVYDLIEEFGNDYFANLPDTNQQAGLKLFNKIHIVFSANSIVTAHYTGNNRNVCTCFSPFNNGKYGFTLENLTLYSSRTRYGVHDVGTSTHNASKYINCHIEQDNSGNEYWPQSCAIGAGIGKQQDVEIMGCVFKGQVYWHLLSNANITDYRGTVRCVDSFFIDNTIQVSASRADAQRKTEFVFADNSFKKIAASDVDGIVRTFIQDASAIIYAWNNQVRD